MMVVVWLRLARIEARTAQPPVSADMVVLGLGLGLVMQVLVLAVQSSVGRGDLGVATSAATFFRSVGGSVGTAIFGAVFANRLSSNLAHDLSPQAVQRVGRGRSGRPAARHALS